MSNPIRDRMYFSEVCADVYDKVYEMEKELHTKWGKTGKKVQDKNYNNETGKFELAWEDDEHTIPKMTDEWGEVEVNFNELEEPERTEKIARSNAYKKIMQALEKL